MNFKTQISTLAVCLVAGLYSCGNMDMDCGGDKNSSDQGMMGKNGNKSHGNCQEENQERTENNESDTVDAYVDVQIVSVAPMDEFNAEIILRKEGNVAADLEIELNRLEPEVSRLLYTSVWDFPSGTATKVNSIPIPFADSVYELVIRFADTGDLEDTTAQLREKRLNFAWTGRTAAETTAGSLQ